MIVALAVLQVLLGLACIVTEAGLFLTQRNPLLPGVYCLIVLGFGGPHGETGRTMTVKASQRIIKKLLI